MIEYFKRMLPLLAFGNTPFCDNACTVWAAETYLNYFLGTLNVLVVPDNNVSYVQVLTTRRTDAYANQHFGGISIPRSLV